MSPPECTSLGAVETYAISSFHRLQEALDDSYSTTTPITAVAGAIRRETFIIHCSCFDVLSAIFKIYTLNVSECWYK